MTVRCGNGIPFDSDDVLEEAEKVFLRGLLGCDKDDLPAFVAARDGAIDIARLHDHCMEEQYSFHPDDPASAPYCSAAFALRNLPMSGMNAKLWDYGQNEMRQNGQIP